MAIRSNDKYALYEASVQSPEADARWALSVYREIHGRFPVDVREDFCGTFKFSCAWVERNRKNRAIAVDLDPEPLKYGRRVHWSKLTPAQKRRLQLICGNVVSVKTRKVDMVVAGNFSFYIFKQRELLVRYFKGVRQALKRGGIFVLEMAGGPGMIRPMRERRTVRQRGLPKFSYIWHQRDFDPIRHRARYSIHFKFASGRQMKDAFVYDWRLWTIPEVREALVEAGFREARVYWETAHQGRGTGEYIQTEEGDNAWAWIAYVVGVN
jgi:SAM-dependent methyltransferase